MSDLMRALHEIRAHAGKYELAMDYYNGEVAEVFTSRTLANKFRDASREFNVNLSRRPIDAVLDRVEITAISAGDEPTVNDAIRDDIWNANRMGRVSKMVHRSSLVYGDSYLIVSLDDTDQVKLYCNSPLTTRVFYDDENATEKSFAAKVWEIADGTRINLYYADRIERWISKPNVKPVKDDDLVEYVDDDGIGHLPNDTGQIPVFHFRTSDPYGRPEAEPAWGPQNAITKLCSTSMTSVDYSAWPLRWIVMSSSEQKNMLTAGGNKYNRIPSAVEDELDPADRTPAFQSHPGNMMSIVGDAKLGQFDAADPENFLKLMGFNIRAMSATTGTPFRFFDPTGEIPSGEALRADEAPLAARIRDREEWWEETWNDALLYACSLTGIPAEQLDIQWAPVQVIDDKEGWETAKLKIEAGVPREQVLAESGYLMTRVQEWSEGTDETNTASRIVTLGQVATLLKDLGAASALGTVTPDQVQQIVESLMGDLIGDPSE